MSVNLELSSPVRGSVLDEGFTPRRHEPILAAEAMKSGEIIRAILAAQGKSQRSLAGELGLTPQALGARLSGDSSMRVESLVQMADALGHKVVIVPDGDLSVGYRVTG